MGRGRADGRHGWGPLALRRDGAGLGRGVRTLRRQGERTRGSQQGQGENRTQVGGKVIYNVPTV